jgi:hypothetical protein
MKHHRFWFIDQKPISHSLKAAKTFYYIAIASYTATILFFLPDNIKYFRVGILSIDLLSSVFVFASLLLLWLKRITFTLAAFIYFYSTLLNIIFSSWTYFHTLSIYADLFLIGTFIYAINLAIGGLCIGYIHACIAAGLYCITLGPLMVRSNDPMLREYWFIICLLMCTFAVGIAGFLYLLERAYKKVHLQWEHIITKRTELSAMNEKLLKLDILSRQNEIITKSMLLSEFAENNCNLIQKLNIFKASLRLKDRQLIDMIINTHKINQRDNYWKDFEVSFLEVNPEFKKKLYEKCSNISPAEYKLATLIHLGLSTKQIAHLINNTIESIDVARSRLKRKLSLPLGNSLKTFLVSI